MLESQRAQVVLIEAQETLLTKSATLNARPRHELDEIETTNDLTRKREIIKSYVRQITVATRDVGPRRKEADVKIHLLLKPAPVAVENATRSRSEVRVPFL
jgi:hypothetical protein